MNKMIKRQCLFHLIPLFSVILVQKMVRNHSGHFGYTQMIYIPFSLKPRFLSMDEYK